MAIAVIAMAVHHRDFLHDSERVPRRLRHPRFQRIPKSSSEDAISSTVRRIAPRVMAILHARASCGKKRRSRFRVGGRSRSACWERSSRQTSRAIRRPGSEG